MHNLTFRRLLYLIYMYKNASMDRYITYSINLYVCTYISCTYMYIECDVTSYHAHILQSEFPPAIVAHCL